MRQNIYDDSRFFARYRSYRRSDLALNKRIEQPARNALLPSLQQIRILDLGCGFGEFCVEALAAGADRVVGLDCSVRMCQETQTRSDDSRLEVVNEFVEDTHLAGEFDLVVSSLVLHYVEDIDDVFRKISRWVAQGGNLIFSINHPAYTAFLGRTEDSAAANAGGTVYNYFNEGAREHTWLGAHVIKYHRTLETYVVRLAALGFRLDAIRELTAPHELAERLYPQTLATLDWPVFLMIRAKKIA